MAVTVGPNEAHPNYHMKLTDKLGNSLGLILCDRQGKPSEIGNPREIPVPRTVLKVAQGAGGYGDFEYPYTLITQDSFEGGRGQEDLSSDATRYYDSFGVDTRDGSILLGPAKHEAYSVGEKITTGVHDSEIEETEITTSFASSFTTGAAIEIERVRMWLGETITTTMGLQIFNDSAGVPGSSVGSFGVDILQAGEPGYLYFACNAGPGTKVSLSASTTYWLLITTGLQGTFTIGKLAHTGKTIMRKVNGLTPEDDWSAYAANAELEYTLYPTDSLGTKFFEYQGLAYCFRNPSNGTSAPRLFQNGWRGMAGATSTQYKVVTTLDLTGRTVSGWIVKIIAGTGSEETQNWRKIGTVASYNPFTFYVDLPWEVKPDATSHFVLLGASNWMEQLGHGLTKPVTDVLVVDDIIYCAQGDKTAIRRGRVKSDATWDAWAAESDIDATYKGATWLKMITDTAGKRKVHYIQASTVKVASSDVKAWGTALAWGTAVLCDSPKARITGAVGHGDPFLLTIFKEDRFGQINNGVFAEHHLSEMETVRSEYNGRAACTNGVYLFFSLGYGSIERYYDGKMDDMGPDRDEGLPAGRQGWPSFMISTPKGIIVSYDAGAEGYSSIFAWNTLGWHEIYRSTALGERITGMLYQVMPGTTVDRLWFTEGTDISWIDYSKNPRKQTDYTYGLTGYLVTSWMTGNLKDIYKYFASLKLQSEKLSAGHQTVTVYFQTDAEDDADAWHNIPDDVDPDVFDTSPSQEMDFSSAYDTAGRRIRLKIQLDTDDAAISPRVKAPVLVETVTRVPAKRSWSLTFFVEDYGFDLTEERIQALATATTAQLRTWSDSRYTPTPLLLTSNHSLFDNLRVFIDPPSLTPLEARITDDRELKLIGSLTLMET